MSQDQDINLHNCNSRKGGLGSPEDVLHVLGKDFKWTEATLLQDPLGLGIHPDLVFVGPERLTRTSHNTLDVV